MSERVMLILAVGLVVSTVLPVSVMCVLMWRDFTGRRR